MTNDKLTQYTQFSGCAAKLGPALLDQALCGLKQPVYPELLVDFTTSDDAGVYQINEDTALVQTTDFFPPIVDDPFIFGQIASANALSDIYAMGGRPVTALSLVGFPADKADINILRRIMEGALSILEEAGAPLVGGHSINDAELKFGLAVTGLVHPAHIRKNNTLKPGDALVLTKPLGTGTVNSALRAGKVSDDAMNAAIKSMITLNKVAAKVFDHYSVHACTDVTGFGLLGHASEMVSGSGCALDIEYSSLKLFPNVPEYIAAGFVPGGTARNREFRQSYISNYSELNEDQLNLLFDPQTSGGLLAAVPEHEVTSILEELSSFGLQPCRCGTVRDAGQEEMITVCNIV